MTSSQQVQQSTSTDSTAQQNSHDEENRIIADLCAGALTDTVRNCLRKYDPKRTAWQIEKELKKDKKDVLVAALDYLGVPDMSQYKADALPHELVCRIQNLLPDTCQLCKQSYCIKLHDKPILSCVKCGQGCHNSCVLQVLGKNIEDLESSNNFGEHLANPYSTLGLFYVCYFCQKEVIPQKEALKLRQNSSRRNSTAEAPLSNESPTSNENPNPVSIPVAPEVQVIAPEVQVIAPEVQVIAPEVQVIASNEGISRATENTAADRFGRNRPNLDLPPVCKHYRTGRCKHGLSGKKDGTCAYSHPKPCNNFLKNGPRGRGGCTRGENCRFFHPQMCHSSLQERLCARENCKFMHIKGTRRSEQQAAHEDNGGVRQNPADRGRNASRNAPAHQSRNSAAQDSNKATDNAFLDCVKALQVQMATLTAKIQQMDANYSHLSLHQQGYPLAMSYPQLKPVGTQFPYPYQPSPQTQVQLPAAPAGSNFAIPISH